MEARVCSGEEHDEHWGGRQGASGCLSELEEQRLLVEARPRCSSRRLRAELPEPRSAAVSLALLILSPLCCLFARNPCPPTPLPANRWLGRFLSPKLGAGVAKSHGCRTTTGKQGRAGGPELPLAFGPRPFERHRTRCTRPLCRRTGTSMPMAPLGFSCTKALLATGLLLLWLAPATLLAVQQPQPFLFVEPSTPVDISCILDETQDGRGNVFWYRRVRGERPRLILSCLQVQGEFSCKYTKGRAVLHIAAAGSNHTGLYLCAYYINSKLLFGNGTALIVGDSWRAQSWVRVLAPHGSPSDPPGLVCAVGNASGPVLVSWPGGPRPQQVLGLGGSTELLISPAGIAGGTGGLCEVRFNASGPPVRRSVELHGAKDGWDKPPPPSACTTPSAVARALLLLGLILGICCLFHAWRGLRPRAPDPPASPAPAGRADVRPAPLRHPSEGSAVTHGAGPQGLGGGAVQPWEAAAAPAAGTAGRKERDRTSKEGARRSSE
nr:uncharacterized protein LOC113839888 isoform X1 [Anas platyrhynchos]